MKSNLPDNYRKATTKTKRCDTCKYMYPRFVAGWCSMWKEAVRGDHVCNKWQRNA